MRWIVGSSDHGCWLGSYEHPKRRRFELEVRSGQVVYDVGANVGFYTLLASRLVGPAGRVIAFEPWPRNLQYLHRHLELNRLHNVTVVPAAVGAVDGRASFAAGPTNAMGALSTQGTLEVDVVSLDRLVGAGIAPPPDIVKMDIEGGELSALEGATGILRHSSPTVFLATHGNDMRASCRELLQRLEYEVSSLSREGDADDDETIAQRRPA